MTGKLSPMPLTELGRRCRSTSVERIRTPEHQGFQRVTCDLPRRHRGMHEHEILPERGRVGWGTSEAYTITQPRQVHAWPPRLVTLAWRLVNLTRRDV